MQPIDAPKPGPHLSPSTPHRPSYRELAKLHADAAGGILAGLRDIRRVDEAADHALIAQAHALTSLAYTQMAPPARYRPRADHDRTGGAR